MIEEKEEVKKIDVKDMKIKEYYKMEDIVKVDEDKVPLIAITMDKMFKAIFTGNERLLKKFILSQLPLDIEEEYVKLQILNSELPVSNIKEYKKIVDIIVSLNDNIYVNLEVNRQLFNKIKNRNYLYKNSMINQTLKSGGNIKKLNNIYYYQINLNVKDTKDEYDKKIKRGTRTICAVELESQITYLNNDITFIKYFDFYKNIYYNKGVKLTESEMWLVMLMSKNYKELYETLVYILNKEARNDFISKVIELSNDKFFMDDWNEQIWDEYIEYLEEQEKIKGEQETEEIKIGKEELKNEKEELKEIEKLLNDKKKEIENNILFKTIKSMLENNIDNETISKITNLSIEEIIKIKKSL